MTVKTATSVAALVGILFSGFWWVHSHAADKVQVKANIVDINSLIVDFKIREIKKLTRKSTSLGMKTEKTERDRWELGDIDADIAELQAELKAKHGLILTQ